MTRIRITALFIISILYGCPLKAISGNDLIYLVHTAEYSVQYLEKTLPRYSIAALTGFVITKEGTIVIRCRRHLAQLTSIAQHVGITIYPVITFESVSAGRRVLGQTTLAEKTAQNIAAIARQNRFTGIHLDFEYLPPEDAGRLSAFLSLLRRHFKGKITMAIFPQIDFPSRWAAFHELSIIAPCLDGIALMCYDYHAAHTGPGPVTSLTWAEKNVRHALRYLKPDQIWLGVPAYGYRWCGGTARPISARETARLAHSMTGERDPSGTLHLTVGGCEIFVSDKKSRELLIGLARRYNLAGIALWRLGFED